MITKGIAHLRQQLQLKPGWVVVLFAALATFSVYTCMYGYRKAFTAASFPEELWLGMEYKVWLVISQVLGYMLSKFAGIRFIAESIGKNRSLTIVKLISISWVALLGFALVPTPYNILFLFANGFPLGLIWGLVFSYVEGRRATELMGAALASSFIFASGFAKTIGAWLTNTVGVAEHWMPFVAGALYFLPMLFFCTLLDAIPLPSEEDKAQRTVRLPMNKEQRRHFLKHFAPGLISLIIAYILLTILRDFRDNFSKELLVEVGYADKANVFAQTETIVAIVVLVSVSLLMLIKNNYAAFYFNHVLVIIGFLIAGISTLLFSIHALDPFYWFVCTGTGLYMGYIPINCLYFDRMIATFRVSANVGFVMYVADSFGYLGSVFVLLLKQFSGLQVSWVVFFSNFLYVACSVGIVCTIGAMLYYKRKFHQTLSSWA